MRRVVRISHVTFQTPDLERQLDYYTVVLGLRLVVGTASLMMELP
jgi:catechol 2,3-dioxygenase-like lactoylglutathione lyase family enzyme